MVASFLLVFMVVVAVLLWLVDLWTQQRVFGFLVSAEFVAFAMLVYLYYKEMPKELSRSWLTAGFAALAALMLLATAVFSGFGTGPTPNVTVTLYAGEVSMGTFGFGESASAITSPGPTLTFKVGDVVDFTLVVAGQLPHNWAMVSANESSAPVLFGAQVGTGDNPLLSGQTGKVLFTVTEAGEFFYICQVPGHLQLGMWGQVVVSA